MAFKLRKRLPATVPNPGTDAVWLILDETDDKVKIVNTSNQVIQLALEVDPGSFVLLFESTLT